MTTHQATAGAMHSRPAASGFGNVYRFAGRRFDAEAGLYYNRHRYYEPRSGRFIGRDPRGYEDALNGYAYVANSPVVWKDPLGQKKCCCCVEEVQIKNVNKVDGDYQIPNAINGKPLTIRNAYGHRFDVEIQLAYPSWNEGACGDCTLEWWERTNIPYPGSTLEKGKPKDLFNEIPGALAFKEWHGRARPCGGKETIKLHDPATLNKTEKNQPLTATRYLEFRIKVTSTKDCQCKHTSKEVNATQTISLKNGQGVPAKTGFRIGRPRRRTS